jgi:drug/metabolite transporter (DMT)-like permease
VWRIEKNLALPRSDRAIVLLLGFLGNFVCQVLLIQGQARTTATNTGFIVAARPVFIALLGALLMSERLAALNWAGILVGLVGVVVLIGASGSRFSLHSDEVTGSLLVLAAILSWSLYTVFARPLLARISLLRMTAWSMVVGTVLLVVAAGPELRWQELSTVSARGWLGLAYASLLGLAVGQIVWGWGIKRLGSARTAVYTYLQPFVSLIVAWLFLGETLGLLQALGAVGIVAGVALGRYRPAVSRKPRESI